MKVEIFKVDHGSCAVVTTPENKTILMDCGSSSRSLLTSWYPGRMLLTTGIHFVDELILSHADEDHVSGLQSIFDNGITIGWIETNDTLDSRTIRSLKPEAPGPGVSLFLECLDQQQARLNTHTLLTGAPVKPNYQIDKYEFRIPYSPLDTLTDINNLSLVTFLFFGGLRMIFPGDLEEAGWKRLLADEDFRLRLGQTNVFIASHHGRRNGFCAEVFDYCKPEVIVFSDSAIVHDTQQMAQVYGRYASGLMFGNTIRSVLTTRNDGKIQFATTSNSYQVSIRLAQ
ncbi:MAG: MBL fold metallo-hydrolase [Pseudomonadota bacterium]